MTQTFTKDEAMQMALDALKGLFGVPEQFTGKGGGGVAVWRLGGPEQPRQAIAAIESALAQEEQEPVAWIKPVNRVAEESSVRTEFVRGPKQPPIGTWVPVYASPPQRKQEDDNERDAKRYRWLRNEVDTDLPVAQVVWKRNNIRDSSDWVNMVDAKDVDSSIDAAMKERDK